MSEILAFFFVGPARRTFVKLTFTLSAFELIVRFGFSSYWIFSDAVSAGSIQNHVTDLFGKAEWTANCGEWKVHGLIKVLS